MSSTLYTIGTALGRALDHHRTVDLLVEGQWLSGQVAGMDGHGVVLDGEGGEHAVVKVERISVVRIGGTAQSRNAERVFTAGSNPGSGQPAEVLEAPTLHPVRTVAF